MHDLIEAASFVAAVLAFLAIGWAFLGHYKKETLAQMRQTLDISKDLATAANDSRDLLKKQLMEMVTKMDLQDRRISRVEVDNHRKTRQLAAARQEVDMLENIVRVAITALSKTGTVEVKQSEGRVQDLLNELASYRSRTSRELQEWEETQSVINTYMAQQPAVPGSVAITTGPVYLAPQ